MVTTYKWSQKSKSIRGGSLFNFWSWLAHRPCAFHKSLFLYTCRFYDPLYHDSRLSKIDICGFLIQAGDIISLRCRCAWSTLRSWHHVKLNSIYLVLHWEQLGAYPRCDQVNICPAQVASQSHTHRWGQSSICNPLHVHVFGWGGNTVEGMLDSFCHSVCLDSSVSLLGQCLKTFIHVPPQRCLLCRKDVLRSELFCGWGQHIRIFIETNRKWWQWGFFVGNGSDEWYSHETVDWREKRAHEDWLNLHCWGCDRMTSCRADRLSKVLLWCFYCVTSSEHCWTTLLEKYECCFTLSDFSVFAVFLVKSWHLPHISYITFLTQRALWKSFISLELFSSYSHGLPLNDSKAGQVQEMLVVFLFSFGLFLLWLMVLRSASNGVFVCLCLPLFSLFSTYADATGRPLTFRQETSVVFIRSPLSSAPPLSCERRSNSTPVYAWSFPLFLRMWEVM